MSLVSEQLRNIVGSENVYDDQSTLEKYSKDQSFTPARMPDYAVYPKTTEEVQSIVKLANNRRLPIIPYSSGAIKQGSTVPVYGGIIVDLSKMNKVVDIDVVSRLATIEPGVSFAQLQESANKHKLKICTAVGLPASASVLSTYLEFVPIYAWSKYGTWFLLPIKIV